MLDQHERLHFQKELSEVVLGGFPLSPGTREGHTIIAKLYPTHLNYSLNGLDLTSVFPTNNPEPPELVIPEQHFPVSNRLPLMRTVWQELLSYTFGTAYLINTNSAVRKLIELNAEVDTSKLEDRLNGQASKLFSDGPAPSIIRALAIERRTPIGHEFYATNQFYSFLFGLIAYQIIQAAENDYRSHWCPNLRELVGEWESNIGEPFFPFS